MNSTMNKITKMNREPLVSIIIVNHNGKSLLKKCLHSINETTYQNYEIILVDNNSSDGSVEFVKTQYPKINIISLEQNYGYAKPNNIGAKKSKGEFLIFLNNDTEVTPNWINELVNVANSDSKIAICQSLLLLPNGDIDSSGDFIDIYGRAYGSRKVVNNVVPILSARGASMLIKKNIFFELDGFDEKFFASFEDVDLGWGACLCGYKVVLVPTSVVYHKAGETVRKIPDQVRFHGIKNTIILQLVNFELNFALKNIFILFFASLMRKFFGISVIPDPEGGQPLPSSRIIFKGIVWVLKNLKYVYQKRKKVNSQRVKTTKDLIKMGLIRKS